ncbi:MAG: type III pantothenate kinase [Bacteroidia bacterium]|nr:type III pantothenate kinase [Bacteroidia bacterium]
MNYLTIDIGNTRVHCGIFNPEGRLLFTTDSSTVEEAVELVSSYTLKGAIMSSVRENITIPVLPCPLLELTNETPVPFTNNYATPLTLGRDRIAVLAAAAMDYKGKPALIFDGGTCLTIDFITEDAQYNGGNISPGLAMRLKAMHEQTGKLPLASVYDKIHFMGHTTLSALSSGAFQGMLMEMNGYIDYFTQLYPETVVLMCGGDSIYFEKQFKSRIFADSALVLRGLYHILRFND